MIIQKKIGVDTAENEPLEVWGENSIHYSFAFLGPAPGSLGLDLRARAVSQR